MLFLFCDCYLCDAQESGFTFVIQVYSRILFSLVFSTIRYVWTFFCHTSFIQFQIFGVLSPHGKISMSMNCKTMENSMWTTQLIIGEVD